jgi:hypothetical protein
MRKKRPLSLVVGNTSEISLDLGGAARKGGK